MLYTLRVLASLVYSLPLRTNHTAHAAAATEPRHGATAREGSRHARIWPYYGTRYARIWSYSLTRTHTDTHTGPVPRRHVNALAPRFDTTRVTHASQRHGPHDTYVSAATPHHTGPSTSASITPPHDTVTQRHDTVTRHSDTRHHAAPLPCRTAAMPHLLYTLRVRSAHAYAVAAPAKGRPSHDSRTEKANRFAQTRKRKGTP